jgi:hypothetical protein
MTAIAAIKTSTVVSSTVLTTSATVADNGLLSPEGFRAPGVARWVDRTGGIPVGYPSFSLSVRPPQGASRVFRVTAKVDLPTLATTAPTTSTGIQPAPTKAYSCSAVLEVMLPERSTQAERLALWSLLISVLSDNINASDGAPTAVTGSPLPSAMWFLDAPY